VGFIIDSNMKPEDKKKIYSELLPQVEAVVYTCPDPISAMASVASILHHAFPHFFWTGFYRVIHPGFLGAGPYQGTLACLEIPFDKGVCGLSATTRETVIVDDVSGFEGYISCDSRTSSEIVVPIIDSADRLIGVLDIDSAELNSFDMIDAEYLEKICQVLASCDGKDL